VTLEDLVAGGEELLTGGGIGDAHRVGVEHQRWMAAVRRWIASAAPDSGMSAAWASIGHSPLLHGGSYYDDPVSWAEHATVVRGQLRWLAEHGPQLARKPAAPVSIWGLLDPEIVKLTHGKFDAGYYADAVETALKHVNTTVKEIVREATGEELDGAALMRRAFSPKAPIIELDDLSTDDGRNIQNGYMDIFAGAMTGIRNPKAHGNLVITPERAVHHLFLASLLLQRVKERTAPLPSGDEIAH
jgi:uncharacterized protein (TIGR02391 family)